MFAKRQFSAMLGEALSALRRRTAQMMAGHGDLRRSGATNAIAKEMAQEILRDPKFRQEMRELFRQSLGGSSRKGTKRPDH